MEKKVAIQLELKGDNKQQIIIELTKCAYNQGTITDLEAFTEDVLTREKEISTGMGHGFGIPHSQSRHVSAPTIVFGRSSEIDWESIDGQPTTCYFLIAVPKEAGGEHLKLLQKLARNLMNEEIQEQLKTEKDATKVINLVNSMLGDSQGVETVVEKPVAGNLKIVAISNCPAGIAHTYMVAEGLERKAAELGHEIKVETQGASGVENRLSKKEIEAADYVILALGKTLTDSERARFSGKKVLHVKISEALKHLDTMFDDLEQKQR